MIYVAKLETTTSSQAKPSSPTNAQNLFYLLVFSNIKIDVIIYKVKFCDTNHDLTLFREKINFNLKFIICPHYFLIIFIDVIISFLIKKLLLFFFERYWINCVKMHNLYINCNFNTTFLYISNLTKYKLWPHTLHVSSLILTTLSSPIWVCNFWKNWFLKLLQGIIEFKFLVYLSNFIK